MLHTLTKKMNKPLIIIPFTLPWNWSADYQRQTILELSKRKFKIIAYMQDDAHFFLKRKKPKYPKVNNVTFYIPKYILPFRRFAWIEKLNKNISLLLFNLSIFFRKKIIWIFDQEFYSFHKLMINKISLYDCVDYHAENQKEYEEILINNTNFLFTNSHTLYELHKNKKNNCKLVVQGFNSSEFNKTIRKVRKIKNLLHNK